MKLSAEDKQDLRLFPKTEVFQRLEKRIFAKNPGTPQATNHFTDFLQFFHKMAGHPTRPPKPITGEFKL